MGYDCLKDVITSVRQYYTFSNITDLSNYIFLTPTADNFYDASEWQVLAMALTTVARLGTKLVAVNSLRGKAAWNAIAKTLMTCLRSLENQLLL